MAKRLELTAFLLGLMATAPIPKITITPLKKKESVLLSNCNARDGLLDSAVAMWNFGGCASLGCCYALLKFSVALKFCHQLIRRCCQLAPNHKRKWKVANVFPPFQQQEFSV